MTNSTLKLAVDRRLALFAWIALGFMVLVILEGAIVRATGSGAGCGNHWPLCNGEILPHHPRLATIIEFTHRSMTGVLTTLCALLIAGTFWTRPAGSRARKAATFSGVFLLTEALLGAVLVKGGYVESNASNARVLVQCVHFTNTMLLVAVLALTGWFLRQRGDESGSGLERRSTSWPLAATTLAVSLLVGATGSVAALADTLFPSPSLRAGLLQDFSAQAPLLVRMRWVHPACTVVLVLLVGWMAYRLRSRASIWVATLLGAQVLLGFADVLLLAPVWLQVLHLLLADLFWIALVLSAAQEYRGRVLRRAAVAGSSLEPRTT